MADGRDSADWSDTAAALQCDPYLSEWFPELAVCKSEPALSSLERWLASSKTPNEAIEMWLAEQQAQHPAIQDEYDLPQIHRVSGRPVDMRFLSKPEIAIAIKANDKT